MSTLSLSRILPLLLLALGATPAQAGGALRYAEDQAPALLNPLFTTSMAEARVSELIFESLYTDDRELRTVPLLAQSAEVAADRLSMRIVLRDGARWQNGRPLTAEDVVFTIQALQDPGTLSTEAGRVRWIQSAVAEDTRTVKLTFAAPEAAPEEKLYFKILPKSEFSGTAIKRTDPFRNAPIGSGPFKLKRYNEDSSISLERYGDPPTSNSLTEIVMREVSDKNYQAKLLLYESLEALVRVLPRDLPVLQQNRKVALYPYQTNSWWYLGFNQQRAPFNDPAMRAALINLVEPQKLLDPVGTGDLLTGPFVRSSPYYNHQVAPYKADPAAAAGKLAGLGYTRTGTWWEKGGAPLKIRLLAHKSLETAQEVVINLQSQLQGGGVQVEVAFLDDASWKAQIWKERNFDVILSQWSFDRNEDIYEQFASTGNRNFTGYNSAQVDQLLQRARTTLDPQEKKAALRQVHATINADQPMMFLWTLDSYSAMSTRVKNVVVHPFYFFTWARDWTLQ